MRTLDYVAAQQALGAPHWRILLLTLLPNIAAPLIVQFSLTVASAMVLESGLSFLGLGVVPPSPSWGLMIRGARANMEVAPLLLLWPCLALCGTVLLLNFLCDRLRDVLDPRASLAARPGFLRQILALPARSETIEKPSLLAVRDLTLTLNRQGQAIDLVRDVSLEVKTGQTLAIVGESGSGKTLTALALMGLLPPDIAATQGSITLTDRHGESHALLSLSEDAMRALRGREIAMVFQDPSTSLNPMVRVGVQIAEGLEAHGVKGNIRERIIALMGRVGLPDPQRRIDAHPHELSGGQKQRVMIAAAIANAPRLLLADEPTTALDVTVQAQILTLLQDLRRSQTGMGMIFVSHNLAVVGQIADEMIVMYAGEVVEQGPVAALFAAPRHPYTAALLASIPEDTSDRLQSIPGTVPAPAAMPQGCRFAARCTLAEEACSENAVPLEVVSPGRQSRCLRWREMP